MTECTENGMIDGKFKIYAISEIGDLILIK